MMRTEPDVVIWMFVELAYVVPDSVYIPESSPPPDQSLCQNIAFFQRVR